MLISCDGRVQSLCEFVDPPLVLFRTRSDILCRVLASVLRIETSGDEGNENNLSILEWDKERLFLVQTGHQISN